jgi:hypothetical protein
MKIIDCPQGSTEWYAARIGRPTASQFHKIITPAGKVSKQAPAYMYRLVAERLLHETMDDYLGSVQWAERGKALEYDAVAQFEFSHDVSLNPVGFITTNDGRLGCSPDRLIAGKREAVEIKCPAPWNHLQYLLEGPGDDYKPQVQGQMLIAELEAVHFYSYHPRCPPAEFVLLRDEPFIGTMASLLQQFLFHLERTYQRAKSLGAYVTTEYGAHPITQAYPDNAALPLKIVVE